MWHILYNVNDMLSIDWDVEFSNHERDVQVQRDIFTLKMREAEEQCTHYPVPDVKT